MITPNGFRNTVLWAAGIVVVFANLAWFLHAIEVVLLCAGALTIGAVTGYVYVRRVLPGRRQRAAALGAQWQRRVAGGARQPLPPPQPAIGVGNVTNNYGHHLALPGDWTPEQIRAFRGE